MSVFQNSCFDFFKLLQLQFFFNFSCFLYLIICLDFFLKHFHFRWKLNFCVFLKSRFANSLFNRYDVDWLRRYGVSFSNCVKQFTFDRIKDSHLFIIWCCDNHLKLINLWVIKMLDATSMLLHPDKLWLLKHCTFNWSLQSFEIIWKLLKLIKYELIWYYAYISSIIAND